MTLKKGEILNPSGRPKGAANKTTSEIRAAFQMLISENIEQLQSDIDKLKPSERINIIMQMANYILPKMQTLNVTEMVNLEYKELQILLERCPDEAIEKISQKIIHLKTQTNG